MWEQFIGAFAVDFGSEGDEFVFHMQQLVGFMSRTGTDGSSPVVLARVSSGELTSSLKIQRHPEGIACVVVGESGTEGSDQVEPWARAASAAAAAVGKRNRDFVWEAIIGTDPQAVGMDQLGALDGPVHVSPGLELRPGGVCMRELRHDRGRVDHDSWVHCRHSYPVIVTGRISTYKWETVTPSAMRVLRRTCAVLSLATGSLWIQRSHPHQRHDGATGLTIPIVTGATAWAPDIDNGTPWTGDVPPTTTFSVPEWAVSAIEHLPEDEGLDTAVHAHYEAMLLKSNGHSSLAHLTFVAAVEGYGMRFVPDEMCSCHPDCTHPKGVAEKRFRKALKTVMSHRQIKDLADGLAYDRRSHTGHRGTLFGEEPTLGQIDFTLFTAPKESAFHASALGELEEASRAVLVNGLQEMSVRPERAQR